MMEETSDWSSSFLVLSAFLGFTSFLEGALEGALEGDFSLLLLLDLSEPASDFFFLDLESGMIQTEYILSHYSIRFILTNSGIKDSSKYNIYSTHENSHTVGGDAGAVRAGLLPAARRRRGALRLP